MKRKMLLVVDLPKIGAYDHEIPIVKLEKILQI